MDFKQLRSFVAVADCGSFTQAAAQLYTSQPTISAHIRQLEEELQQRLFLRTTKSLSEIRLAFHGFPPCFSHHTTVSGLISPKSPRFSQSPPLPP